MMKKQIFLILACVLANVACTKEAQTVDAFANNLTLSANVENPFDATRAGMESDGRFFWHEGDNIGVLMTNGNVRPMTLVAGDGGKSSGTFEVSTNETLGEYAIYPYNNNSVTAEGDLTISFPSEYNYGSIVGEKENDFGFAMWARISNGSASFKHLGGVFKIYVHGVPVGENLQFVFSTIGKKLTGAFQVNLNDNEPVLTTSDDEENDTVTILFSNAVENATAVFYIPAPVGVYPVVDVVAKDANGNEFAFGNWINQEVVRRAQKRGSIGKKVIIGGDDVDGVNIPEEGVYEISNLAGLKWFADEVNKGNTFAGAIVKLTADVDLANEQWTPIGYWTTFDGTFDGQGYTISNLKHHGTEADCYVGLFGYTLNATIKNVTINNADIKLVADNSWAGGHMGALIGNCEGNTVIENVTVKGDVKIDGDYTKIGASRIGGVVGGNVCSATFKNVYVNASADSFVRGNNHIGGIAGQLQGSASFENCSSNIEVSAYQYFAGGIIGCAPTSATFVNCHSTRNISVINGRTDHSSDHYRVGAIAGGWDDNTTHILELIDCSYSGTLAGTSATGAVATTFSCGGFVGHGYSLVVGAKVRVNGVEYIYLGDGNYQESNN